MSTFTPTDLENEIVSTLVGMRINEIMYASLADIPAGPEHDRCRAEYNSNRRPTYSFFDGGIATEWSGIWLDVLIGETGNPKIYRGVVTSLIKKGFFSSVRDGKEFWLSLTDLAVEYINTEAAKNFA